MKKPGRNAGLTAGDVQRWLRGLQPVHVERFLVAGAFFIPVILRVVDRPRCSAARPSICGPSVQATWTLTLVLATVLLLVCAPTLGCLGGIALGALGMGHDPASGARGWWAACGALSFVLLVQLMMVMRRQQRIAAARAEESRAPVDATPPRRLLWSIYMVISVCTAFAGLWLISYYLEQVSELNAHLANAVRVEAVVQSLGDGTVDLVVPELDRTFTVEVRDPDTYRISETVPALVDSAGGWIRLVAEPEDLTGWLSVAILLFLVAGVILLRPVRVWRLHRRLRNNRRAILVGLGRLYTEPVAVFAVDGSGPPLATLRVIEQDAITWSGRWKVERSGRSGARAASHGAGNAAMGVERAYLAGQLWYGGVVHIVSADGRTTADAIVRMPQWTPLRSWRATPPDVAFESKP
jgi:hypothetical protein